MRRKHENPDMVRVIQDPRNAAPRFYIIKEG